MEIINKNIDELIPYVNNPRKNKDAVDKVASSIKEFGFKVPVVIDKDNVIVTGHTRLLAAKKLGIKEIPCIIASDLTPAQIKAFRIADNKVGEYADWDTNLLKVELEELKELDFDLDLTGFEDKDLDMLLNEESEEVEEDNFDLEKEQPHRINKGEIFELGEHRLMCGDSFKCEDINRLMNNRKADIAFCDPPYDMDKDDWISNLKFVKEGSPILLMAGDKQTVRLCNKVPNFRQFMIHNREQAVLVNTATPMSQHTMISLFCDHPKKYFVNLNDHFTSIIDCNKNYSTAEAKLNAKMGKPVKVPAELISHYSKKEDLVFDLFGGGGSTLIACQQLNRICYINELEPTECDKIIARWEQFTGEVAEKIM